MPKPSSNMRVELLATPACGEQATSLVVDKQKESRCDPVDAQTKYTFRDRLEERLYCAYRHNPS
jgi:uncharacterized protein YbaR (Trm112 family)